MKMPLEYFGTSRMAARAAARSAVAAAFALLWLATAAPALADEHFGGPPNLPAGPAPQALTAGDLDRDGDLDSMLLNDVNHGPIVADDAYSTGEDAPLTVPAPGVLANDFDPDGDALTARLDTGPANGAVTLNSDGSFTYTPEVRFAGVDSFTYQATDGPLISAPATVTITVAADLDDDDDGIPDAQDPDTVAVVVSDLPDSVFANGEHRGPLLNRLNAIEQLIAAGDLDGARTELENLARKVDGCGDEPDTNDWITDCTAQLRVRGLIDDLLAHLSP
jgi:Bacterial Ig domain